MILFFLQGVFEIPVFHLKMIANFEQLVPGCLVVDELKWLFRDKPKFFIGKGGRNLSSSPFIFFVRLMILKLIHQVIILIKEKDKVYSHFLSFL